ncbi:unnamed protein product [Caenorhabditis nigoni]|uniref:Potassium channel domain-containing protein n=2 Tax=Caenorhabditis nigoni TaxID=1611254 RepID=A0A2G5SXX1_9PELO|nr:hypothetical protein B9Z55_025187 [Caenorhabditis nigoni]
MAIVAAGVSKVLTTFQKTFKGLLPLIILVIYTLLGAWIFWMIEGENEREMLIEQQKERDDLIRRTVYKINQLQIKRQRRLMTAEEEYNRTAKVLTTFQETLGILPADMDKDIHWTFLGSIFYCMTVYTTIGYGNIVPGTGWGRFATIVYAFLGIPLTVLSLYCLGSLFAKGCKILWKFFLRSTRVVSKDLSEKISEAADNIEEGTTAVAPASKEENDDDDLLSFPISGLLLITVIWVIFCAVLFTFLEEWDFGTSLYFTLISFTTIGFGDILPSDYDFMPIVGVLLLIGLSLVSTVMTLIQQQIEALASGMKDNIDQEYARALNEAREDGEVDEHVDPEEDPENNKKSLDSVVSRMPWSKRGLYYLLPASQKKQLEQQSEKKMGRKSIKVQTDSELLETLIREEILKAELNNEMHKFNGPRSSQQPRLVNSTVREKEVPIEVVRVEQYNHGGQDDYLEHDI